MNINIIWNRLFVKLEEINTRKLTKEILFNIICGWLRSNRNIIGEKIFKENGIDYLIELDVNDYLENESDKNILQILNEMKLYSPSSLDGIGMYIEDILWRMVIHYSDVQCPNCECFVLSTLYSARERTILLGCDNCSWVQYENGEEWTGKEPLRPAKKWQLNRWKL